MKLIKAIVLISVPDEVDKFVYEVNDINFEEYKHQFDYDKDEKNLFVI